MPGSSGDSRAQQFAAAMKYYGKRWRPSKIERHSVRCAGLFGQAVGFTGRDWRRLCSLLGIRPSDRLGSGVSDTEPLPASLRAWLLHRMRLMFAALLDGARGDWGGASPSLSPSGAFSTGAAGSPGRGPPVIAIPPCSLSSPSPAPAAATFATKVHTIWKETKRNAVIASTGLALLASTGINAGTTDYKNPQGTVYTTQGEPLPGVVVTLLNVGQDTTDTNGNYNIQFDTSSVPELPSQQEYRKEKIPGNGCAGPRIILVPIEEPTPNKQEKNRTDYLPNRLTFEKDGHWLAQADITDSLSTFTFNAVLPANIGTFYGETTLPEQFGPIWRVINQPTYDRLISYRREHLPIPVDISVPTPENWAIVQERLNMFNEMTQMAFGIDFYVLAPGNGMPTREPEHRGIYIFCNSFQNQGQPMINDPSNPQYLLGGFVYLQYHNFIKPSRGPLDKETFYRLGNFNTWEYDNGIFEMNPTAITNFNKEHILLLHTLFDLSQPQPDGTKTNHLIGADYVLQFMPEPRSQQVPETLLNGYIGCPN